jgi:hypothetical protein
MKIISISSGVGGVSYVIEYRGTQYCVTLSHYNANEVWHQHTPRKVRNDSKLHATLCTFATNHRQGEL